MSPASARAKSGRGRSRLSEKEQRNTRADSVSSRSVEREPRKVAKTAGARGRHRTPAERAEILQVARTEGLTGAQVAKRYGISTVTYYLWRKRDGHSVAQTNRTSGASKSESTFTIADDVRSAVENKVREVLPGIVRHEVSRALENLLKG